MGWGKCALALSVCGLKLLEHSWLGQEGQAMAGDTCLADRPGAPRMRERPPTDDKPAPKKGCADDKPAPKKGCANGPLSILGAVSENFRQLCQNSPSICRQ